MLGELQALLQYQYDRIDFIDEPVDVGFDCPLDLHCTYTRDQLLVALDFLKPATVREGVSSRQMPVLVVQERIPICARCNQPIKRVKLKDGSIMQAAEFAAAHEGMCADCYKATRLNVA